MISLLRICFLTLLFFSAAGQASDLPKLKGTFLIEHETFLLWYAKQQGWDKELGFELELNINERSGSDILLSHYNEADNWDVCGVGAVPAALYSENLRLDVICVANDESSSTDILVRNDSQILKEHGWNQDFPNAKGSPDTVRNKTFYLRKNTSSFYTFLCWLELLGLNLHEVEFVDMPPSDALVAMSENKADGAVMWSPNTLEAMQLGYTVAAKAEDVGAFVPVVFIADREYAQQHKDLIARFVAMFMRAVRVQKKSLKTLVGPYQEFMHKYTGHEYSSEFCKYDLEMHPVYGYDSQLKAFTVAGNRTSPMLKLKNQILSKFTLISLELSEPKNYMTKAHDLVPTDEYLKLARQYLKE